MPPKAKFTREKIVEAALQIVREVGMEGLTSRSLGKRLGSSVCPIFTVFSGMEEIQNAVINAAKSVYKGYVDEGLKQQIPFRGVGEQYVRFAEDEPRLFHLLFMNETAESPSLERILPLIEDSYEQILSSIMRSYGLLRPAAERLYCHLWIYTHGIACLCATKTCQFSEQEIRNLMTEICQSLMKALE